MRGLILSLLTVTGLLAQTNHITGNYLDLLDNPIDSASVYYYQDQVVVDSTLTNSSGAFDLQFTIVSTNPAIPSAFSLSQNYPNPFNPSTRIDLSIREPGSFSIYDIRGALVEKADLPSAGSYELTWGGRNLGAGLYIYVLRSGQQSSSRKMILLDGGDGSGLSARQLSFGQSGALSKLASNDRITFVKQNTSGYELSFTTPLADTSLGNLNGNVGPQLVQAIPDTSFYEGEPWGLDWNDYFYNDSETIYTESVFVPPDSGDTHYQIIARDLVDSTLSSLSNVFSVAEIPIAVRRTISGTVYEFFSMNPDSGAMIITSIDTAITDGSGNYTVEAGFNREDILVLKAGRLESGFIVGEGQEDAVYDHEIAADDTSNGGIDRNIFENYILDRHNSPEELNGRYMSLTAESVPDTVWILGEILINGTILYSQGFQNVEQLNTLAERINVGADSLTNGLYNRNSTTIMIADSNFTDPDSISLFEHENMYVVDNDEFFESSNPTKTLQIKASPDVLGANATYFENDSLTIKGGVITLKYDLDLSTLSGVFNTEFASSSLGEVETPSGTGSVLDPAGREFSEQDYRIFDLTIGRGPGRVFPDFPAEFNQEISAPFRSN